LQHRASAREAVDIADHVLPPAGFCQRSCKFKRALNPFVPPGLSAPIGRGRAARPSGLGG
jgi:hypothetical protein